MDAALRRELERCMGSPVAHSRGVSGGDINHAFDATLADGRRLFIKVNPRGLPKMFQREADGLRWLAEAKVLRVPGVVAARDSDARSGDAGPAPAFLVLEWIDSGASPAKDFDEQLGRGLAELHRAGAPQFGLEQDNYIATLLQRNRPSGEWPSFYAAQRLQPQLELAANHRRLPNSLRTRLERVMANIEERCGPVEPPARLHGDLWGGNVIRDERGSPTLIDPAAYAGHREVDLAMMQLFGGFGPRCFAAYDEVYPRAPGHERRVPLYQLYPLLVHLNLFGGAYVASLERALNQVA